MSHADIDKKTEQSASSRNFFLNSRATRDSFLTLARVCARARVCETDPSRDLPGGPHKSLFALRVSTASTCSNDRAYRSRKGKRLRRSPLEISPFGNRPDESDRSVQSQRIDRKQRLNVSRESPGVSQDANATFARRSSHRFVHARVPVAERRGVIGKSLVTERDLNAHTRTRPSVAHLRYARYHRHEERYLVDRR